MLDRSANAQTLIDQAKAQGFEFSGHDGPGKFEGHADRELAEALHFLGGDMSWFDEFESEGPDGDGWAGLIGAFIVGEDSVGFYYVEEFSTAADALETWNARLTASS